MNDAVPTWFDEQREEKLRAFLGELECPFKLHARTPCETRDLDGDGPILFTVNPTGGRFRRRLFVLLFRLTWWVGRPTGFWEEVK